MSRRETSKGGRLLCWGAWVVAGAVSLVLVSQGLQASATLVDERRFPPPGRLIDVGGYRLHIVCRSPAVSDFSGTVVLDAGAGGWSLLYEGLLNRISEFAHVCGYDRAGLGASDEGPAPRTSAVLAEELKVLLERGGIREPYVLVGFSLGGYNTRVFAEANPTLVTGIVLAESGHERQWEELPHEFRDLLASSIGGMRIAEKMSRLGMLRLMKGSLGGEQVDPEIRRRYEAVMVRPRWYRTMIAEAKGAYESAAQVGRTGDLGSRPLAVVTAGNSLAAFEAAAPGLPVAEGNRVWARLQEELLGLSSNSRQFLSVNSTHDIASDDPDIVVDAVRWVIEELSTGERTDGQPKDLTAQGEKIPASELRVLPRHSVPEVDGFLRTVEEVYASMDVDQFVSLFSRDFVQLDPNRRVRVQGREAWQKQTERIINAHRSMGRRHYGRLWLDPWLIVELEWWGTLRGDVLGRPGEDIEYRYSGLGLVEVQDGRITRQVLWGDYATLQEQLGMQ